MPNAIAPRYITPEQSAQWQELADKLQAMSKLADECYMLLVLDMDIRGGKPLERIQAIQELVGGESYMFTPQTEWTGGDSAKPENFKDRLPHVAR
ncbi:hypothetical protein UFOVP785_100 [uncultured Caudovirales phage]|uniref:Uncharacterized protein n=1 Tax=uncultured Caudovirales phage TaxID=2100421 RepID=A0A6J5NYF2_9CAUD|nr:hypothetical protein UFOVP785_100 [uncultured Caudovirales phage]